MLNLCKLLLRVLRVWPLETSPTSHVISYLRYFVKLLIEVSWLIGSFLYVLNNLDDVDEATEPGFVCFALGTTIFIYVWLISKKRSIETVIEIIESNVNERIKDIQNENEQNGIIQTETCYDQAEIQYTKLARRYILSWSPIVCFYAIVLSIVPVNDVYHRQMDAGNWTTLFKVSLPLDDTKISSFLMHCALDFVTVFIHFTIYSASCTFHMATALYVSAMVSDIKSILKRCDTIITATDLQPKIRDTNIQNCYHKAISFHANILNLVTMLKKIMSGVLFIIIANSIIFMAVGLFQMETKTKAGAFEVYVSLNSVMLQSALIWMFCYHSALVTMRLSQLSDFAYSVEWYRFSKISQKCALMLIRQSNKRFAYTGFGIMQCDMQTLSMMVNSVVSYYLLLKKM